MCWRIYPNPLTRPHPRWVYFKWSAVLGRSTVNATEVLAGGFLRLFCRTVQIRLLPNRRVRLSLVTMHFRAQLLFGGDRLGCWDEVGRLSSAATRVHTHFPSSLLIVRG